MRIRPFLLSFLITAAFSGVAHGADPAALTGKVDAVTVYRGEALVTRLVDVPGPAGLQEVVVTGLPEQVVPGSLFAEADADVEVRSVRYRTRPVSQDVREDIRKLDAQIRDVQDQQAANIRSQQLDSQRGEYLDKLEQFTASTATTELSKGVLNAETLKTLTLFLFDQRQTIATDDLKLAKTARDLIDQLALLQQQRSDLTAGANKLLREAVVFANFTKAGGQLRIKYLVNQATWSPSYVARAADGKKAVTVQYDASIQQMSGEDWTDVTMTLSTATPSMVATAPQLDPLALVLGTAPEQDASASPDASYGRQKDALKQQQHEFEDLRNSSNHGQLANAPGMGATTQPDTAGDAVLAPNSDLDDAHLNDVAKKLQVLELITKDANDRAGHDLAFSSSESVSVTYQLPARTSLPSRADQQSIQIATLAMVGDFYKLAMPVLTSYVYDQATITNSSKIVLLAGQVSSYFDDQYVGVGTLPTVAVGEQFSLGFGIDSSLRATRELTDKTETTQGGNRVMTFNYRLAVENFGSKPATVRLVDRLPTSKNADVKITVTSTSKAPTDQAIGPVAAGAAASHEGILNWNIDAAAQSMGEKAAIIDYSYKLEFDKQLSIGGMAER